MKTTQQIPLLLSREEMHKILKVARENLEKDGSLCPTLFVQLKDNQLLVIPINDFPSQSRKKRQLIRMIGRQVRKAGSDAQAAVLLSESWIAEAPADQLGGLPPSEHPERREAIILMGRNEDNSIQSSIIQPFSRDGHNHPVFDKSSEHIGITQDGKGFSFTGLHDEFFDYMNHN